MRKMEPRIVIRLLSNWGENAMENFKKIVCKCNRQECPFGKEHCCLGEIDPKSLNEKVPLVERHCCKKKNSRKVIGTLAG